MPCFNYLGLFNWTTIVKLSFVEFALFRWNEQYSLSRQRKRLIQINYLIYIFLIKLLFNITTHSTMNAFLFEYLLITTLHENIIQDKNVQIQVSNVSLRSLILLGTFKFSIEFPYHLFESEKCQSICQIRFINVVLDLNSFIFSNTLLVSVWLVNQLTNFLRSKLAFV